MDEKGFDRRSENRVVHYKKTNSICNKTSIVSRGIELSSIVELQNLDKFDENYLSEVNPSAWLKRVIELKGFFKLKEALDLINLVIKIKPKLKEAFFIKSEILRWSHLPHEAIDCYNETLTLTQTVFYVLDEDPRGIDFNIYQNLAGCFIDISDYESAVKASEKAILLCPDRWGGWEIKADCYYFHLAKYDAAIYYYDKAINILKKAISINHYLEPLDEFQIGYFKSRLADDLIFKGGCLNKLKKYEDAIEVYQESLTANPSDHRGLVFIGLVLEEQNKYGEALKYYLKAISINEMDYNALNSLGNCLRIMGRTDEALNAINKGLEITDKYNELWISKGICLKMSGKYEEAIKAYEESIKVNPNEHRAWHYIGKALQDQNKDEEAISYFLKALKLNKLAYKTWNDLGYCLRILRRNNEALDAVNKGLEINPGYVPLLYNKALTLNNLEMFNESLQAWDSYLKINPSNYEAWERKGDLYNKLGRIKESEEAYKIAASLKNG